MGAHPNSPLITQLDDIVTWNNTTNQKHWPWPVDANNSLLPDSAVPEGDGAKARQVAESARLARAGLS